jgi:protein TonB
MKRALGSILLWVAPFLVLAEVEYSPPIAAYLEAELVATGRVHYQNNQAVLEIEEVLRNQTSRLYVPSGKVVFGRDRYSPFSHLNPEAPTGKYLLFFKSYKGKMYLYAGSQHIYALEKPGVYPICAADSVFELNFKRAQHALNEFQKCFSDRGRTINKGINASTYAQKLNRSEAVLYALQNPYRLLNPYIDEPVVFLEPDPLVNEDTTIYQVVEQMPAYPTGAADLMAFVRSTINYPPLAKENGIQGKVYIRFVVEKDGELSHIEVVRGVHPLLDQEAIRVVEAMPAFEPGKQRGKPVRCNFIVPVPFRLS